MTAPDLVIAASFVAEHRETITAIATVVVAIVIAQIVDRALSHSGQELREGVAGRSISAVADTRLRLVRRLIFFLIIVIGIALALAQFPAVKRVATGLLASSALLGLVVGFAARQTLANVIAGIVIAITQPIRVGDLVTFEDETGEVEDIRLAYTYIRLDNGQRLIVPNESLAQSSVHNHTVVDPRVKVEIEVWLPPGGDATRALELLAADEGVDARVSEVDHEGITLVVASWAENARERGGVAARLRKESLERLRDAGLSSVPTG
ncbi:MAG TPA: mechanosensitive ion channel domain-containing protein [Thermoleophilaceae bacterium]|nr:mechanosensitive ion channel domain-containing protein [Thermoleophilaceae bacterium]